MSNPERILLPELARMTGKTPRALQAMAARGAIPSAAKIGRQWTFDRSRVRRWIASAERQWRTTSINETGSGGSKFRWPERSTDEACERALGL